MIDTKAMDAVEKALSGDFFAMEKVVRKRMAGGEAIMTAHLDSGTKMLLRRLGMSDATEETRKIVEIALFQQFITLIHAVHTFEDSRNTSDKTDGQTPDCSSNCRVCAMAPQCRAKVDATFDAMEPDYKEKVESFLGDVMKDAHLFGIDAPDLVSSVLDINSIIVAAHAHGKSLDDARIIIRKAFDLATHAQRLYDTKHKEG